MTLHAFLEKLNQTPEAITLPKPSQPLKAITTLPQLLFRMETNTMAQVKIQVRVNYLLSPKSKNYPKQPL